MEKIVAITMGDPGGIGPEVTLKALALLPFNKLKTRNKKNVSFLLIGPAELYLYNAKKFKLNLPFNIIDCLDTKKIKKNKINILNLNDDISEVEIGLIAPSNAALSFHSLEVGAYLAREKQISALVTAPINKEAVQLISPKFSGHTEYLARITKTKKFAMLLQGGGLRCVLLTTHIPLKDVPNMITAKKIQEKAEIINAFLNEKMKIRNPKIAVASLNPHNGEGGKIGEEDTKIIMPAVKKIQKKGININGPIPADIVFYEALNKKYDVIIAMYHDQALGPLKMIAFHSGVNLTLNLPFIRTSPDHGTAFDIAYKNKANPSSMQEAIKTAISLI